MHYAYLPKDKDLCISFCSQEGQDAFLTLNDNFEEYCRFIWSRTIFEKHTAPGTYNKHAPGAVCFPYYGPGAYLT